MFDDLAENSGFNVSSVEGPKGQGSGYQAPAPQSNSGYGGGDNTGGGYGSGSYGGTPPNGGYQNQQQGGHNNGGYQNRQGGGGYQNQQQGGGNRWNNKPDEVAPPYLPVVMFVEKGFPIEVKQKFYQLASKFIGKGYTVRINPDDPEFVNKVMQLSTKNVELYLPFKNFNQFDSKHSWNTATSKAIAQQHFPAYDKIPDAVKAILAAQIRMVFGDRNNSITLAVITYSPDGASRIAEITRETGRVSFIIKVACTYGFTCVNLGKQSSESMIEKYFDL